MDFFLLHTAKQLPSSQYFGKIKLVSSLKSNAEDFGGWKKQLNLIDSQLIIII